MAIAVDGDRRGRSPLIAVGELGWLAVAGGASLAAGAIHASAIGVHPEHRQAAVAFTALATLQLGWGAVALARPGRVLLALGGLANLGSVVGFVLAKTSGIAFVDGLEQAEPVQTADGLAAGLAIVAVLAVAAELVSWARTDLRGAPLVTGVTAVLVAGLAVPGMLSAGTHSHADGGGHSHGAGATTGGGAVAPAATPGGVGSASTTPEGTVVSVISA